MVKKKKSNIFSEGSISKKTKVVKRTLSTSKRPTIVLSRTDQQLFGIRPRRVV